MRYLKNKLYVLLIAVLPMMWSCGDEEPILFTEAPYVSFQSETGNVGENNTAGATITVARSTTDISGSLTVDLTVTGVYTTTTSFFDAGSSAEGTFTISSTSITFDANEAAKSVTLTGVDDALSSGDKTITVTISGVSDPAFKIGTPGPDDRFSVSVITIIDDDCPIDLSEFEGAWTYVDATGTVNSCCDGGSLNGFGFPAADSNVTLTADASDPTGTTAILSGGPFGSDYTIQFITCAEEVVALGTTDSFVGSSAWTMAQGTTNGTYTTTRFTVVGVLGGNGDFEMEFTKN